jgi:translation elongation factor 2 (EF-2/EF-G)
VEKLGQIYTMVGKERRAVNKLLAGDIGVVLKLKDTHTNDTLADKGVGYIIRPTVFPEPLTDLAIKPKTKGDEERLSSGLYHLHEEDPSFRITRDEEFAQTIISGLGEIHLETIIRRLREKFDIEVETAPPRVPYRETIRAVASAQGKYKSKQAGAVNMVMFGFASNPYRVAVSLSLNLKWLVAWCRHASCLQCKRALKKPCKKACLQASQLSMSKSCPTMGRIIPLIALSIPSRLQPV